MRLTLPVTHHSGGLSETIVRLRERVETTSEEAVTGRYKDMTAHLSGRIGKAMLGQKAIDDVSTSVGDAVFGRRGGPCGPRARDRDDFDGGRGRQKPP